MHAGHGRQPARAGSSNGETVPLFARRRRRMPAGPGFSSGALKARLVAAAVLLFVALWYQTGYSSWLQQLGASAQTTIAQGYAITPSTCVFTPPSTGNASVPFNARLVNSTYLGGTNSTLRLDAGPSFNFSDAVGNFSAGQVYVPDVLTFTVPYCTASTFQWNLALTTPGCVAPLYYAYNDITAIKPGTVAVPVDPTINGAAGSLIQGVYVPANDVQLQFLGTVTWFRPNATCPSVNPLFRLSFLINNLFDVADGGITAYTDSGSGETKYCVTYGLRCNNLPRQSGPGTTPYDPLPQLIPICRQTAPPLNGNLTQLSYEAIYGVGFRAPINVPLSSIVYMLRADNIQAPYVIWTRVTFEYPIGGLPATQITGVLDNQFSPIQYVVSPGTIPARVTVQYYSPLRSPLLVTANEALLSYLPACNCGTSPNIVCNPTNSTVVSAASRADVPNFNAAVAFTDLPTCVFYVNNGNPIVQRVNFQVQSGATGGVPPLQYAWRLLNLPPSAGVIFAPANTAIVTMRVDATVTFTIRMIVYSQNNASRQCDQPVTVIAGFPTASVFPTDATIFTNTFLVLDASGSSSPNGIIDGYLWQVIFPPPPATGWSLNSTTGKVVLFTASVARQYQIIVRVRNNAGETNANVRVTVLAMPPQQPPTTAPVQPPGPCPICVPELTNPNISIAPSQITGAPLNGGAPGLVAPYAILQPPVSAPGELPPVVALVERGARLIAAVIILIIGAVLAVLVASLCFQTARNASISAAAERVQSPYRVKSV